MQRKAILIGLMVMALLFAIAAAQGGPLTVRTQVDKTNYAVGDLVTLKVFVENNPGLHSIYFDLTYDGSVLSFDSLSEGTMVTGELRQKEFLYAASDPQTSSGKGHHLIVSYTLQGSGVVSPRGGLLLEARFRVIAPGNSNIQYKFDYAARAVTDGAGNEISGVVWQTPQSFSIGNGGTGAFVLITKPHEMQVVNLDQVEVDAVCSPGLDYFIKYENQTNQYTTDFISAAQIDLPSKMIPIIYGYNNIAATLYQRVNGVDYIIATNNVRVYRPQDGLYVKILSPKSHQLVNTDMVDVVVSSPYEQVTVNGLPAVYYEPGTGSHKLYRARLWLKKGFNTITAEATGTDNVKFKDTIQIYYQKDSSIFSFTMPRVGEYFKPGAGTFLRIEGEIDSPYRSGASTADGLPAPNTVTLRVIFKPFNYMKDTLVLVNNKLGKIVESTGSIDARSQYKFTHDFEIPLEGLGSGEIEIIAYKNKEGNKWDDEIHRIVYLDDNRLWIDLVQPNVYTHDLLDTYQRITNFNETKDPQMNNINIAADGAIGLAQGNPAVSKIGTLARTSDLAEAKDGTIYALVNSATGSMSIYKKGLADQGWTKVLSRSQMYGYELCMTEAGLLVGVSNLYATGESGLYLLKDKSLVNIQLPVTLQHVQFIEERNGLVYLYGNYYNYLYGFNVNTLTESAGSLTVEALNRTNFPNNDNLKQLVLSSDCETAILRTESGSVRFYNKTEAGYLAAAVTGTDGSEISGVKNIIAGEYASGDYNVYLLLKDQKNALSVMEYTKGARKYFVSQISFSDYNWLGTQESPEVNLLAAGFRENAFLFLYQNQSGLNYQLKQGQVYFNRFYETGLQGSYRFPETPAQNQILARLFATSRGQVFLGAGSGLVDNLQPTNLFCLYNRLDQDYGEISFNYVNDDVEGLTGFSFEVDPLWLAANGSIDPLAMGFAVKEKKAGAAETGNGDLVLFEKARQGLGQLLQESENQFYTLSRQYDPATDREVVHVEFKNIQEGRYLSFKFKLTEVGDTSPEIYNLKIYKKVHAKVCAGNDERVTVPIHGYVYDRTVNEVTVQQTRVPLGPDRSFNYNYEIYRTQNLVPVEISCVNSSGETARIRFMVEIVKSENGLGAVKYSEAGIDHDFPASVLEVTNEKMVLSGKYYGLEGAAVGYEICGYQYQNGVETVVPVKRGLFETDRSNADAVFAELGINKAELGSGYTAGTFGGQEIELIPGRQQLRIYVENPGGLRSEFKVNGAYPEINYSMLPEDQRIVFDLDNLEPPVTVQNVPLRYRAELEAFEEEVTGGQGTSYRFKRSYEMSGEIKSLYNFSNLIVKSFTPGLTFEDGSNETSVSVTAGNRFKIKVNIVISENVAVKDFDLGVFPSIPSQNHLKTGVRLTVRKNFKDTNFIPDFSRVHPDNWSAAERKDRKVPIRVKFNRSDLPTPEAWLTLTVNNEHTVSGYLEAEDGAHYILKDENHQVIFLPGLKQGRNRIQWVLQYRAANGQNSYVMSSSNSGKPGMTDYLFDYTDPVDNDPTAIVFEPDLTGKYYKKGEIPLLKINKDLNTQVTVKLNGMVIKEEQSGKSVSLEADFNAAAALREGKNEILITYQEQLQDPVEKVFSFLYDSKDPEVAIAGWKFGADNRTLEELTAVVTEANFAKAYLYYGTDINSQHPEIAIIDKDKYLLRWTGLGLDILARTITVTAFDHADNHNTSELLSEVLQRQGEENIPEVAMEMPLYTGEPALGHESNYRSKPFSEHTKFAPKEFLNQQSVKEQIIANGNYWVQNHFYQKVTENDLTPNSNFGTVAISGNIAIVGAHLADLKGEDSGAAYIYEMDENRVWHKKQTLTATDGTDGDYFGFAVALSGNRAIIGAYGDDDRGDGAGAAYIFERDENGVWTQIKKLTVNDGDAGDAFGYSVGISRDFAIVGAYLDDDRGLDSGSAYIFACDNNVWNVRQKLTDTYVPSDLDRYDSKHFGYSVAINENRIVIGIPLARLRGVLSNRHYGGAALFKLEGDNWTLMNHFHGHKDYGYGETVAISKDFLIIGSPREQNNTGSFTVWMQTTSGWHGSICSREDYATEDYFGEKLALSGNTLIISARGDDDRGADSGSVYVLEINEKADWPNVTLRQKITASDGGAGDQFGSSVAISGDKMIVGAINDDDQGGNSGSVYFYNLSISDHFVIPNDHKYLVFKIVKGSLSDPLAINEKSDVEEKIQFEAVGFKQDTAGNIVEVSGQPAVLTLDEGKFKYIEGYNNFYYIVEIAELKEKFLEACQFIFPMGEAGAGYSIYDWGSLRVKYTGLVNQDRNLVDIYVTGDEDHVLSDILYFDQSYSDLTSPTQVNPVFDHVLADLTFGHSQESEALTLNFWLRLEDEGLLEQNYIETIRKRVFTIFAPDNNELLELGYRGNSLYINETICGSNDSIGTLTTFLESNPVEQWNMITLRIKNFQSEERVLEVGINGYFTTIQYLTEDFFNRILMAGNQFRFGPHPDATHNTTGFYSIANAFYIDRYLSNDELRRIYNMRDKYLAEDREYNFHSGGDFGEYLAQLRIVGNGTGCFSHRENVNAKEPAGYGSLKASSKLRNLLRVEEIEDTGKKYVIFDEAGAFVPVNITVEGGMDGFTLKPAGSRSGRYYFGDKNSNYSLGLDRWYSISGTVREIGAKTNARMVLRINEREQSWKLQEGRFHFIYDNTIENLTPSQVKLYVETDGPVTLGTDLTLNQGNYVLPETLESSAAKTSFPFGLSGTVDFWYKPLNANPNGLVNYYKAVLFDSELMEIKTVEDTDHDAVFQVGIKGNAAGNIIKTIPAKVKVKNGWQHLQVSYDFKESENRVVYFYIDGKLAGTETVELTPFGSLIGEPPYSDNVWIGCDQAGLDFAQGYLDEVKLSKYYQEENFSAKKPARIVYDEANKQAALTLGDNLTIDSGTLYYTLEGLEYSLKTIGENFPVDLSGIPAGRYRLTTEFRINGHNYQDILFFNINNRPRFVLKEKTPIVFRDVAKDVKFKFGADVSYRFSDDRLLYLGLAGRISYDLNGETKTQTRYLVQDFLNQDTSSWLLGTVEGGLINWEPVNTDNAGLLELVFPNVMTGKSVDCRFKYFYFETNFEPDQEFDNLTETDLECRVPIAILTLPITPEKDQAENEYKLVVDVTGGEGGSWDPIFEEIQIEYHTVHNEELVPEKQGSVGLSQSGPNSGKAELYYDDILGRNRNEPAEGAYTCRLKLKYQGVTYMEAGGIQLIWSRKKEEIPAASVQELEITEFSLLRIDRLDPENPTASFYLKYAMNGLGVIAPKLEMIVDDRIYEVSGLPANIGMEPTYIFNKIPIPKRWFRVRLTLSTEGFIRSRELEINNTVDKPEISLTNAVDALIQYNNVLFSWKGYYQGRFNEEIEYQYNLDNQGWSTPNSGWRSVRFYNLAEGYHNFQVRAVYHGVASEIREVTFFVDIERPRFDPAKITAQKVYDSEGVCYAVNLTGAPGAVNDISLTGLSINQTKAQFQPDGSFSLNNLPLKTDGVEKYLITAYDKVGNYSEHTAAVENRITEIIFPAADRNVRYSPMTLTGKINSQINTGMKIYVADTQSATKGDYSGWKQAKINPDRTFFVEDLFINPGTAQREILTTLRMACVFDSGKTFEREIQVRANEVLRPIEMNLSAHAAEGENSNTEITIDCKANVPNISTWSIDFDGDGVYDLVDMVQNPGNSSAQEHSWTHKYSTLGLVTPRVRVITTEGDFFSTADTLIIHEKIKEASFKMVTEPLAISTIRMIDQSNRVFTLCKKDGQHLVEVYEIRRNDNYISRKLFDIDLTALEIQNPVKLKALDGDNLMIAANIDALGVIYQLRVNQFGNYEIVAALYLEDEVADLTIREDMLLASMVHRRDLFRARMVDGVLDQREAAYESITIVNALPLGERASLETDGNDIFLADYYNQRIIRLSPTLKMVDQFGARGNGEAEFIWPGTIRFHQNRIFVSDSGRHDIQVFDGNYSPICTLGYRNDPEYYNYVEPEFFNDVADFEVIAREEGNRLYYYALVLSRSVGKLSMIRLPQWEELKVRVRNNKIVFVKDGEIFTAKPDGSDLGKVLSSDSLPRIEGMIDYPALAPDGRRLAFTSRIQLYNGKPFAGNTDNIFTYDKLYYVNLENKKLTQVDLGDMNGYEIERPVFNSNGSKLVFSAKAPGGKWRIYTYDFESGRIGKLFEVDENARFPYFSPDDNYVVFTSDFGGDEEIEIVSVDNPSVRIAVTKNNCRDSLPVWSTVYPGEIENQDLQKIIKSKIAFVSERNTHKGVYCVYLAQEGNAFLSIYNLKKQQVVGDDPDRAALEVTTPSLEGDYPCFTGDGRNLIFEYYDGRLDLLKKLDFESNLSLMLQGESLTYGELDLVLGATRPSGMKNMITNFKTEMVNGNELKLTWNRYTDNDIFYIVQYKPANSDDLYQNHVLSQTGTIVPGLKMGMDYLARVFIVENDVEVATSYWAKLKMPEVVARPSFEIDPNNPYLVRLHAWKPEPEENYKWRFSWIVENTEIQVQNSRDYMYEFGTGGTKTIFLKAYNEGQTATHVSDPLEVEIVSDMKPVIEHTLAEDASYIELSAEKSLGKKLNLASAQWTISGPGREPLNVTGSKVIVQLDGFHHKINVGLTLQRIAVNGQSDVAQVHKTIDLELKELKPVITYEVSEQNQRLVRFSGEYSQGNINWNGVRWTLFADGGVLYSVDGVTAFEYLFPETNQDTIYTATLSIPRRNDGKTETVSQVITMEATPIEPRIDYQILEWKDQNGVVGAKLVFDCTGSKGSGIDYAAARWVVPAASNYNEQSVQVGPTAAYNLSATGDIVIEVSLTLSRKNGADPMTITKLINIGKSELAQGKLIVNKNIEDSVNGKVLVLDAFKSTGPNIDWERTEWVIDGGYIQRGPVVRKDLPAVTEDTTISFTCNLYRFGAAKPETITETVKIGKTEIKPIISVKRLSGSQHRMYELSVLDTQGVNIDWERTDWYIYDGSERAIQLRGSVVCYDFPFRSDRMGYPVLVEMYLKGNSYPFVAYTNIDVEGDELIPIITTEVDPENQNIITFKAIDSKGSNINWSKTMWSFGDSSAVQYGPVVTHEYPITGRSATYQVTLTLTRTGVNGTEEVKTITKATRIGPDKLKAVIKVTKNGDNLVLSAEESEGKGLLLDRSVWLFDGEGDQESSSMNTQGGIILRQSYNNSRTTDASVTVTNGVCKVSSGISLTGANSWELEDYNYYKNGTSSFSTENTHVGAVCRRYVGGKRNITVTLFVYRATPEGGMEGEAVTVNINVSQANGVYGK